VQKFLENRSEIHFTPKHSRYFCAYLRFEPDRWKINYRLARWSDADFDFVELRKFSFSNTRIQALIWFNDWKRTYSTMNLGR
jgi:hypothetical protein